MMNREAWEAHVEQQVAASHRDIALEAFVRESNRIEGITREPTDAEIDAHLAFLALATVTVESLCAFVSAIQPGAVLRDREGLNVRVGRHLPPRGGEHIGFALQHLLRAVRIPLPAINGRYTPYSVHLEYEKLHPFTDGNGRSGRALWLWMMKGDASLGFLHRFYYQTLDAAQP